MKTAREPSMSRRDRVQHWSALLLDDQYFPYFLDWAISTPRLGVSDIVLFLLGADVFKFPHQDKTADYMNTIDVAEQYVCNHPVLEELIPPQRLKELATLRACRVPLIASLAVPCNLVWGEYERSLEDVYSSGQHAVALKKKIISGESHTLLSIVSSNEWRGFFEKYIENNEETYSCYKCWRVASAVLENIDHLRAVKDEEVTAPDFTSAPTDVLPATPVSKPSSASFAESFLSSLFNSSPTLVSTPPSEGSVASSPAIAAKGTPLAGTRRSSLDSKSYRWVPSTSEGSTSNNTDYFASVSSFPEYDFTEPYEAFAFLITAIRTVQNCMSWARSASESSAMAQAAQGSPLTTSAASSCFPSDVTRLELQTVLTMTSMVRSAKNVQSVELEYAKQCAQRLARLMHAIEREAFSLLSVPFNQFLTSDYFLDLMGFIRCHESENALDYYRRLAFLKQVKSLGELHWRDSDDGRYYLKYRHAASSACNVIAEKSDLVANRASHVRSGIITIVSPSGAASCGWTVTYRPGDIKLHPMDSPQFIFSSVPADGSENAFQVLINYLRVILGNLNGGTAPQDHNSFWSSSDLGIVSSFESLLVSTSETDRHVVDMSVDALAFCAQEISNIPDTWVVYICDEKSYSISEMLRFVGGVRITQSREAASEISDNMSFSVCENTIGSIDQTFEYLRTNIALGLSNLRFDIQFETSNLKKYVVNSSLLDHASPTITPSVLHFYQLLRPRSEWCSLDSLVPSSTQVRSMQPLARSVSLPAVMRLVGGPANMATILMMLISGRSLVLLSSSFTSVVALRWALQSVMYPFPMTHLFKDLTMISDSSDVDGKAYTNNDVNPSQKEPLDDPESVVEAAVEVLLNISLKKNFATRRHQHRKSIIDILKGSGTEDRAAHTTPLLVYATHSLFVEASKRLKERLGCVSKISNCFVFDVDANRIFFHGHETEEDHKLISFISPAYSTSIRIDASCKVPINQCANEAIGNLTYGIEKLQADWSNSGQQHEEYISPDRGKSVGSVGQRERDADTVVVVGAGMGCRRKLRRATQIFSAKLALQKQISSGALISDYMDFGSSSGALGGVGDMSPVSSGQPTPRNVIRNGSFESIGDSSSDVGDILLSSSPPRPIRKSMLRKAVKKTDLLMYQNEMVMRCFQLFVAELFLRHLPERISHYPDVDIVSCDVRALLNSACSMCKSCAPPGAKGRNPKEAQPSSGSEIAKTTESSDNISRAQHVHNNPQAAPECNSPHYLFLSSVVDSLSFALLLEEHGVALSSS